MKKRKFSRRFKLLVQRVIVLAFLAMLYGMAKWTGEGTPFVFLTIILAPILVSDEVILF